MSSTPRMGHKFQGVLLLILSAIVLALAGFITYESLMEAYGAGPPYFSRTENMDKWSDPVWKVFAVDLVLICIALLLARAGIRKLNRQRLAN